MVDARPIALRTPDPAGLSHDIRAADDALTGQRRRIVALSLTSAACMGLVALYQSGFIRHLPEPPLPRLDADKVNASEEAYARLSVGDALIEFTSDAATLLLAGIGGRARHRSAPWLPDQPGQLRRHEDPQRVHHARFTSLRERA